MKGTYSRIGKGLTTRNEGWDSTIRVDLQEVGIEVLSLSISLYPLSDNHALRSTDLGEDDRNELDITFLEPSLGDGELGNISPAGSEEFI